MTVADTLPVRVLLGVYLGVVTGIIPALVTWGLAVVFRYVTGLTVPSFAVVVLGVAIAGVNGGFMAFNDPTVVQSANSVTLVTAILVVMLLAFYTHAQGDKLGAALPHHVSLRSLRERTLSTDVVEMVGGRRQVRVEVVGAVEDLEGYPPLPDPLRGAIGAVEWTFPADLPLHDLESRFADRLRSEFDVADAVVEIDERARATVRAAPPASGVSRRVPPGERAVSVPALVPTGVARGDEVTVLAEDTAVEGTVVSARSGDGASAPPQPAATGAEAAEGAGDEATDPPPSRAPTTTGGDGRVTVAVDRAAAEDLLGHGSETRVVVLARGTRREYELVSLLRQAGKRVRRLTVREGGPLDGTTIGAAGVRETHGVAVLAVRTRGEWTFAPRGATSLGGGDDLFAVGTSADLDAFVEAVA